jgi:CelD/BcsL family acetyltransferase involved in cellulose biosynthesis
MSTALLRSERDWLELRQEWDTLLANSSWPSVFLCFDYLHTAYHAFHAGDSELFIITVRNRGGALIGIAPFRRSISGRPGLRQAVLEYLVSWETDKPYLIAARDCEETVWEAVVDCLASNPELWDLLKLMEMPVHLPGLSLVEKGFSTPAYEYRAEPGPDSPLIDLGRGWEAFIADHRKFRRDLNRLNKLEGGYRLSSFSEPAEMPGAVEHYMSLERRSWKLGQVGLQKDERHKRFYERVIPTLAEKNHASIHFLEDGSGRRMAGLVCIRFGQTLYPQHTVYDPGFANLSPGKLIMGLALKEHMADPALKWADLLCGFADYYKPWAAQIIATSNVRVFRLSLRTRLSLALQRLRHGL